MIEYKKIKDGTIERIETKTTQESTYFDISFLIKEKELLEEKLSEINHMLTEINKAAE